MSKVKVRIAFNREASDMFEEKGWPALVTYKKKHPDADLNFEEIEFSTKKEAEAYLRGIDDGNGWDCPWAVLIGPKTTK